MKTIFKIATILVITISLFSCDNDNNPSPNDTQCNYQGLTFLDTSNNTQTLIPEADLTTDFFPNNGGPGIPAVEIYGGNPFVVFTTNAVTVGATENINIIINGTTYPVTVTCQRAGTQVGEEFRYDVTANNVEAEYCVVIDSVNP
ncbi:hypothetical protein [Lutibacter sp.]|uniref:hypothetical protein n=1 Tax=Lutibacter sp. TaxID=1925666 RepID=UPI0025B82E6F|nr:hypothetical protein [Lutibacter sp.]MCF6168938.1 hypothetical protein [Lutibacter sp.]